MSISTVITKPMTSVRYAQGFSRKKSRQTAEDFTRFQPRTKAEFIAQIEASRTRIAEGCYLTETEAQEMDRRLLAYIHQQRNLNR